MRSRLPLLRVLPLLAGLALTVVGVMALVPLMTGWRGPAGISRQAMLQEWLDGEHPSRAAIKLVATGDYETISGAHYLPFEDPGYVWVMAESGGAHAGLVKCPATWSTAVLPAGPGHGLYLGGCVGGSWPPFFDALPNHPSPPTWWPLPALRDWLSWTLAVAIGAGLVLLAARCARQALPTRRSTVPPPTAAGAS